MEAKDYAVVQCAKTQQYFLLGAERVEEISQATGRQLQVKQVIQGKCIHVLHFILFLLSPYLEAEWKVTLIQSRIHL